MEILFILVIVLLFYLILLKPVIDRQRRTRRDISELGPGDRVLTTGGLLATVKRIDRQDDGPTEIVLDLGNQVEVRAVASAIEKRLNARPEPATSSQPPEENPA
jgi:preprotein translocase subunit YajC